MLIREANKNDVDSNLLKLYIEGFNMHYSQRKDIFSNKEIEELKNNLINLLENLNEIIFVIDKNDDIIGYAALQFKDKTTKSIWIDEIIIDNNYRNNGYGKDLINEIFKFAKENDCQRIELNCWSFNADALKFYDKLGFKQQRVILEKEVK